MGECDPAESMFFYLYISNCLNTCFICQGIWLKYHLVSFAGLGNFYLTLMHASVDIALQFAFLISHGFHVP